MRTLSSSGEVQRVAARLGALTPGDKARWGRMSVTEMLRHLHISFLGAMSTERDWGTVPAQPLPPRALKFAALRLPIQWPRNVETVSELEREAPRMQHGSFAEEQTAVLQLMARFVRPEQVRGDHPMFGTMSYWDWMRWGYLHADHHLRQFGR